MPLHTRENTNYQVRNTLVFQETWVLHSVPLGRAFVLPCGDTNLVSVPGTLVLKEGLESHLPHTGMLAAVIKKHSNECLKITTRLDQN